MDNQVEEIKKKLDIVDVINHYLPLKKRGHHYIACCPFHQEKTPSFIVSPELQIYKCFGCGKAGDVYSFVQEFERIDFKEALEDLAKIAGITLVRSQAFSQEELHRKTLFQINEEVAKFYHYILTKHPLGLPALSYLKNRGIQSETINLFKIGFSPSNTSLILSYLQKKNFNVNDLIATGTFGKSQYGAERLYDRFQDRLVFPLIDSRDKIIGFSGRILPSSKNPNLAKYINSPETPIYHKSQTLFGINLARESIKNQNSVIVVEGEFDMISPYQAGIKNIVAIKGTAFTTDQLQLLRRYTDTLILGLDSDFAGNNAARKSIELADSMEFDLKVIDLDSTFKDPDEAIKKDPQIFKDAVANAIPVWDFLINSAVKANDPTTIKGKKAILSLVQPFIAKISNEVIRSDYQAKLAAAIGSSPESVKADSVHYSTVKTSVVAQPVSASVSLPSKIERLESYLLSLVFSARLPISLIVMVLKDYQFITPKYVQISHLLSERKKFIPAKFSAYLPAELAPTFQSIYLAGTSHNFDSHTRKLEVKKTLSQLLLMVYREQLSQLNLKIAQAEMQNNETILKTLENEYNQLLNKISRLQAAKN